MYKVHTGYTSNGRNKWQRFNTLDQAKQFCAQVQRMFGYILTIEKGD